MSLINHVASFDALISSSYINGLNVNKKSFRVAEFC